MPSLDDLGTRSMVTGTPAAEDLMAFYDVSEFGNDKVKRTTITDLATAIGGGSTDTIETSDGSAAAAAGGLGEYVEGIRLIGAATPLADGVVANVTSVSLTRGEWDVDGIVHFQELSATVTLRGAGASTVSATAAGVGRDVVHSVASTTASQVVPLTMPRSRILVTSTTTVYLVAAASFSAGAVNVFGFLSARRVR